MACRTIKGPGSFWIICSASVISERKIVQGQDITIIISLNLTKFLIPFVFD